MAGMGGPVGLASASELNDIFSGTYKLQKKMLIFNMKLEHQDYN